MKTLEELLAERPVDREKVEEIKREMIAQTRGYRLREMREALGMTQGDLARSAGISQRQISRTERGDFGSMTIGTLRRHIEALGGTLRVDVEVGNDTRYRIG